MIWSDYSVLLVCHRPCFDVIVLIWELTCTIVQVSSGGLLLASQLCYSRRSNVVRVWWSLFRFCRSCSYLKMLKCEKQLWWSVVDLQMLFSRCKKTLLFGKDPNESDILIYFPHDSNCGSYSNLNMCPNDCIFFITLSWPDLCSCKNSKITSSPGEPLFNYWLNKISPIKPKSQCLYAVTSG